MVEPHFAYPLWQLNPQVELLHVAVACAGALHPVVHEPQCWGSVARLTHCPLQLVSVPQSSVQVPLAQTCPDRQAEAQAPQLFGSVRVLTQACPHFVSPALQVKPQTPELQPALPPAGAEQALAQAPQLPTSLCTFLQVPLQRA